MLKSHCNNNNEKKNTLKKKKKKKKKMQLLGREPTTLGLRGYRRNHYATDTDPNSQ